MIINTRSPYFIEIDEAAQIGSKIELFIYGGGGTLPATATYILAKPIASVTQTKNTYNITPFIVEFINNVSYDNSTTAMYANVVAYKYKEVTVGDYTLIDTVNFVAFSGYNNYVGGYNQSNDLDNFKILSDKSIEQFYLNNDPYADTWVIPNINVYADLSAGDSIEVTYQLSNGLHVHTDTYDSVGRYVLNIPITRVNYRYKNGNQCIIRYYIDGTLTCTKVFTVTPICEDKYTPTLCYFINRFGGWQHLYFFKAQSNSIVTQNTKYNTLAPNIDYDIYVGKAKRYNINGNKSIKVNTGWVNENYSSVIQDLLLSETILLDDKPVIIKTQNSDVKSSLNDRNINYEIEFDYNFDLINNVL
jgi:hypothetical protein